MENNVSDPFVDTDILIRLLSADDPIKQAASADLFEKVQKGKLTLRAPVTVIADAVYVLSSPKLYNLTRVQVRDLLSSLIKIPNFKVDNKQALLKALDLYATRNLDFGDAFLISLARQTKAKIIYSYDRDFDKISGISRKEP